MGDFVHPQTSLQTGPTSTSNRPSTQHHRHNGCLVLRSLRPIHVRRETLFHRPTSSFPRLQVLQDFHRYRCLPRHLHRHPPLRHLGPCNALCPDQSCWNPARRSSDLERAASRLLHHRLVRGKSSGRHLRRPQLVKTMAAAHRAFRPCRVHFAFVSGA